MGKLIIINNGSSIDLSKITALSSDVKYGKSIIDNNGNIVNGTMTSVNGKTVVPKTTNQTVISTNQYAAGNIIVQGDADLIASNIRIGKNIFGVSGNLYPYYISTFSATPTLRMTMRFNSGGNISRSVYYIEGTVPANVHLIAGLGYGTTPTEYSSIIYFDNASFNFVFVGSSSTDGVRLYSSAITSYRYQSGANYRLPLSSYKQLYFVVLLGYYTS